jgi:hypothetical protein
MGWASGSELFGEIIGVLKKELPDDKRRERVYKRLIVAFQNHDWDTESECMGDDPVYDALLKKMHPDWDWGDEDDGEPEEDGEP